MFFADDLILFGQATLSTAHAIDDVLSHFCHLSGQKVSNEKSRILFSKNTPDLIKNSICSSLDFMETKKFDKYLGFPLKFSNRAARTSTSLSKIFKESLLVGKPISSPWLEGAS